VPHIELTGEGLVVRTYREGDAPQLFAAVRESIAEVSPWLSWCHQNYSIAESREFVSSREAAAQSDEHYSFAIFSQDDPGRLLGGVGLNFINRVHQIANLGYWVRTSAAGKGVATRATRLAARFAFEQLGFHRVEIVAAVNNVASQRVAERAGALREAVLRKRLLIHGEPQDAVMFSLVREDLPDSGTDFSL
jgi:RimJ/RimL family protein N-acetyltransferase